MPLTPNEKEKENKLPDEREPAIGYVHTTNLPEIFNQLSLSLFVTTYQAQRILCLTAPSSQRMAMLMRVFPRPTGFALELNRMAMCSKNQIWFFSTTNELCDLEGNAMPHDWFYVPRRSHVTGDIASHQVVWQKNELLIVNTRFSCLCTLDPKWSFVPGWKPRFISAYVPEDRCHLNGVCLKNGRPKYATALGETDTKEGWRPTKATGGIVIDIPSGEIITRGLSMPHTPVYYRDKLWVLESGTGSLLVVDEKTGQTTTACRLPGFLRGLSFIDRYAFVGLCKIREKRTFGGLPIEEMISELKCAIHVIDIITGATVAFIDFTKGIEELFDIQVLQGPKNPHIVGFEEDTIDGIMILPPKLINEIKTSV
jgi:uncharacterized protein (TIGR03032 family)